MYNCVAWKLGLCLHLTSFNTILIECGWLRNLPVERWAQPLNPACAETAAPGKHLRCRVDVSGGSMAGSLLVNCISLLWCFKQALNMVTGCYSLQFVNIISMCFNEPYWSLQVIVGAPSLHDTKWVNRSLLKWSRVCWSVEVSFPSSVGARTILVWKCASVPSLSCQRSLPGNHHGLTNQLRLKLWAKPEATFMFHENLHAPWRAQHMKHCETILNRLPGLNPRQCSLKQGPDQVAQCTPWAECQCSWEVTKNGRWGVSWGTVAVVWGMTP